MASASEIKVPARDKALVPTDLSIAVPQGTYARIVAHNLSRKKNEETCKLLHTILFGRSKKVSQVKSNISQFSGFLWHANKDKQKNKIKEKLDKCVEEKLLELCNVLDLPVAKTTARKEDVTELLDFFEAPQATSDELLADKEVMVPEQSSSPVDGQESLEEGARRPRKESAAEEASTTVGHIWTSRTNFGVVV